MYMYILLLLHSSTICKALDPWKTVHPNNCRKLYNDDLASDSRRKVQRERQPLFPEGTDKSYITQQAHQSLQCRCVKKIGDEVCTCK